MSRPSKTSREKAEEKKYLERLGRHLRELRESKNLTPQDLAEKLGVTPQYIYMIETGRAKPSEKRLNELAHALGDLADEFLKTALTHVEEEFAAKLREAGLSPEEIEEAAQRVSARAKSDVVAGKEPLRVARKHVPEKDLVSAVRAGEEIVSMAGRERESSAYQYARSVKGDFQKHDPHRGQTNRDQRFRETIKAGADAHIVVDRPLTREEKKTLQDIANVIAHLLAK